jgi:Icc-related predicted phosphoesterase
MTAEDFRMSKSRTVRVAVSGDLHFATPQTTDLRKFFASLDGEADILALVGDLTTHGTPEQVSQFVDQMDGFDLPVVTVFGNHDFEAEQVEESKQVLRERGIHVLDGENVVLDEVGFAGTKGFGGGFGRGALGPFGEPLYKQFVQAAIDESLKLESALRTLRAPATICLLHYAPIPETLKGEPEDIFPFLGSSRLLAPIEIYRPDVVFHGHAHIGTPSGKTPGGIPVYNVAAGLLEKHTGKSFRIWNVEVPDRRGQGGDDREENTQ